MEYVWYTTASSWLNHCSDMNYGDAIALVLFVEPCEADQVAPWGEETKIRTSTLKKGVEV